MQNYKLYQQSCLGIQNSLSGCSTKINKVLSYKENKTPWQIAKEKAPHISVEIAKIPPVDLCALLNKKLDFLSKEGYDVYSVP